MNLEEAIKKIYEIKYNENFDENKKTEDICNLINKYNELDQKILKLYTLVSKYYYVKKDEYHKFINNYLEIKSNIKYKKIINIFDTVLLNTYMNLYMYEEAEKIYLELVKNSELDSISWSVIGNYLIKTHRYELAYLYLNRENVNDNTGLINKQIIECNKRKNSNGYFPSSSENKEKFYKFLDSIKVNYERKTVRAKQPEKINKEDYPKPIEYIETDFDTFVAFDIETTGLDHTRDSITELSAIRIINGKIKEEEQFIFSELVHPYKTKIPKNVETLTGITNEMVKDCRTIWEVFNDFVDWLGDDILLGYNCMMFDSLFLVRAGRLSNRIINNKYFDVMKYIKRENIMPNTENLKLNTIAKKLNIENPHAHRALSDAITTAKVYLALKESRK